MSAPALIIGASGQVGQALAREIEKRGQTWVGTCYQHPEVDPKLKPLDLEDFEAVERVIVEARPSAVYLPSGWTWVDGCEDDPAKAMRINAEAPEVAAQACASLEIPLVYYSTEYVFGEKGGPYDEVAKPNPLGAYAKSKLAGELRVQAALPAALIIRTTVVYGPETQGKNFVYQLVKSIKEGKQVNLPKDQLSSPTYNCDLARASVELIGQKAQGIWNVAGPEMMDRASFGFLVASVLGLDANLIRAVSTHDLGQKAARPLSAGLKINKMVKALGWTPLTPRQGLEALAEVMGPGA